MPFNPPSTGPTTWPNMVYAQPTPQTVNWTPPAAAPNTTSFADPAKLATLAAAQRASEKIVWPPDYPTTINPMPTPFP